MRASEAAKLKQQLFGLWCAPIFSLLIAVGLTSPLRHTPIK